MIVRYENSLEDMVALNRYHCDHSPAVKRTKLTFLVSVSALLIVGSLFIPTTKEAPRPFIIAGAIAFVGIFAVLFNYMFSALLDRNVRRLYREGTNKGILGQHELEIDDSGLVERTEVNETRQAWQGVERIVETDDHIFIYISSVMAHRAVATRQRAATYVFAASARDYSGCVGTYPVVTVGAAAARGLGAAFACPRGAAGLGQLLTLDRLDVSSAGS